LCSYHERFSIVLTCSASSPWRYRVYPWLSHGGKSVRRVLPTSTNTTVSQCFHTTCQRRLF
jgi:hypothetical protein